MTKWLIASLAVSACAAAPLPHRQAWEAFPQAVSPPAECPAQYEYIVGVDDVAFFLYCFGDSAGG